MVISSVYVVEYHRYLKSIMAVRKFLKLSAQYSRKVLELNWTCSIAIFDYQRLYAA